MPKALYQEKKYPENDVYFLNEFQKITFYINGKKNIKSFMLS